jgi:hypothetical protein
MKFKVGDNRFRVLSSPIIGNLGWKKTTDAAGKEQRKPIRKRLGETFAPGEIDLDEKNPIKHFWVLAVWNYKDTAVQILEIPQITVIKSIDSYARDSEWGDPRNYDLVVSRVGEGKETEYLIKAQPPKQLLPEVATVWDKLKDSLALERLFDGLDPFGTSQATPEPKPVASDGQEGEVNVDEIPF